MNLKHKKYLDDLGKKEKLIPFLVIFSILVLIIYAFYKSDGVAKKSRLEYLNTLKLPLIGTFVTASTAKSGNWCWIKLNNSKTIIALCNTDTYNYHKKELKLLKIQKPEKHVVHAYLMSKDAYSESTRYFPSKNADYSIIGIKGTKSRILSEEFTFDLNLINGVWAESVNSELACVPENLHFRMKIDRENRKLIFNLDRKWKISTGEYTNQYSATILETSKDSLVVRYDNETRKTLDGEPIKWEMYFFSPDVYQWRETSWESEKFNQVVGNKCAD